MNPSTGMTHATGCVLCGVSSITRPQFVWLYHLEIIGNVRHLKVCLHLNVPLQKNAIFYLKHSVHL